MKNLKIKNIAFVSAFILGGFFCVKAYSQTIDDSVFYPDAAFSASNTGLSYSGGVVSMPQSGGGYFAFTTPFLRNTAWSITVTYSGNPYIGLCTNSGASSGGTCGQNSSGITGYSSGSHTFTFTNTNSSLTGTAYGLFFGSTSGVTTFSGFSGGGSSADLVPNAYALRSVYNIQSAALNAGLSYDCTVFDKEGLCLSTGGRYSTTNAPYATSTSGLLIGSYKYDKNIRLGAWIDQNLSTNNADGVKLGNSKPMIGVFGVWSERNDGLGYKVKVSAGYGEKDLTVTRTADYQGSAKVNTKGIQSVSSYGIALDAEWIAAPYAGLKYVSISRGGYTEGGSSPLTYDTLRQETTSAVAGVKFTGKIDPQTFAVLSAGVEHDLNHNVGQYSAGSSNTTAFNSDVKKTRPVVSAGVYYDIDKTQRVGLNATHRQEAFQSTATTSALATYTVGF